MKLASGAPIEDEGSRDDEKRHRLRRFYRAPMLDVRCAAANFVSLAVARAVIIANLPV